MEIVNVALRFFEAKSALCVRLTRQAIVGALCKSEVQDQVAYSVEMDLI